MWSVYKLALRRVRGLAGPLRTGLHCGHIAGLGAILIVANLLAAPSFPNYVGFRGDDRNATCASLESRGICERKDKKNTRAPGKSTRTDTQRALLDAAFASLAPQRKGTTDLYTIGIAGWADQDVFIKELDGGLAALAKTLPTEERVLRLVNHKDTVGTTPLATRQNLAAAVRGVGRIMDKSEDVLILFMTSHGSPDGFALQLPGAEPVGLTPRDVARVLKTEGIKNRVVIVSACYSGIFVRPLANDTTIVLTAADSRSPSFGCSAEREWTYFGDAFFHQSLAPGTDFKGAFAHARELISGWELRDRLRPSNPQAHFGQVLVDKLAPIFTEMAAGH